jgi:hypothetical protein
MIALAALITIALLPLTEEIPESAEGSVGAGCFFG